MKAKTKLLIYLIILAILDLIVPLPLTAFILLYVLIERPKWFQDFYEEIYRS